MSNLYPYKGTFPTISKSAFTAPSADIIGDVIIGEESTVWFNCTIRGDVNEIRIGSQTSIQDNTVIHVARNGQGTYVGDRVTVGHSAILHACTIEDDVVVGNGSCVMDDCYVEKGAIVAANAFGPPGKRVGAGEVWAGNPAKKLRDVRPAEVDFFHENMLDYCSLAKEYNEELGKNND
jgi:carbonic anhydrase/acetyltransferase-like protein (isoleucine patch superfamily)